MTFETMMADIPVGRTNVAHWIKQDISLLNQAAEIIAAHDANPWVFAGDMRHLKDFMGPAEEAAWNAMNDAEKAALVHDAFEPWSWMVD